MINDGRSIYIYIYMNKLRKNDGRSQPIYRYSDGVNQFGSIGNENNNKIQQKQQQPNLHKKER